MIPWYGAFIVGVAGGLFFGLVTAFVMWVMDQ